MMHTVAEYHDCQCENLGFEYVAYLYFRFVLNVEFFREILLPCPGLFEEFDDLPVVFKFCIIQSRVTIPVFFINVCTGLE